ncbi:MAG: hypothetical protein AAFX09_09510 [Pseudomonadota bacterium]
MEAGSAGTIYCWSARSVVQSAQDLYGRWDMLDHEQNRSVIEAVVEKVVVGERELEIHLHYVPSSSSPVDGKDMQ